MTEEKVALRTEDTFADAYNWTELAKKYKVRLPFWHRPCTTGGMRQFLRKINYPVEEYIARTNSKNLKEFPRLNPDWPLRAWCGIELEWLEERNKPPVEVIEYRAPRPPRKSKPKTIADIVEEPNARRE